MTFSQKTPSYQNKCRADLFRTQAHTRRKPTRYVHGPSGLDALEYSI